MFVLDVALAVLALSFLAATWRLWAGPTDADRALAVDYGFVVVVAGIAVLAVRLRAPALLDLVLVATLVGFLATVAVARLIAERSR